MSANRENDNMPYGRERSVDRVEWTLPTDHQERRVRHTITGPRHPNLNQFCQYPHAGPSSFPRNQGDSASDTCPQSPSVQKTAPPATSGQRELGGENSQNFKNTLVEGNGDCTGKLEHSSHPDKSDSGDGTGLDCKGTFPETSTLLQTDHVEETIAEPPAILNNQEICHKILFSSGKGFGAFIPYRPNAPVGRRLSKSSTKRKKERSEMFFHLEDTDTGGCTTEDDESEVSEISIVWGKTVDADEESAASSHDETFRSELRFTPIRCSGHVSDWNDSESQRNIGDASMSSLSPSGEMRTPTFGGEEDHPIHSEIFIPVENDDDGVPDPRFVTMWTGDEDEEVTGIASSASFSPNTATLTPTQLEHLGHNIQFVSEFQTEQSKTVYICSPSDKGQVTYKDIELSGNPSQSRAVDSKRSLFKVPDSILSLAVDPSDSSVTKCPENRKEKIYHSEMNLNLPSFEEKCKMGEDDVDDSAIGADTSEGKEVTSPADGSTSESGVVLSPDANDGSTVEHLEMFIREPKSHILITNKNLAEAVDFTQRPKSPLRSISPPHFSISSRGIDCTLDDIEASDDSQFTPVKPRKKKKGRKKKRKQSLTQEVVESSEDPEFVVLKTPDGKNCVEKPSGDMTLVPQKSPDDEDYIGKPSEDPKSVPQKSPYDGEDYTEKPSEDPKPVLQKSPDDGEDYTEKPSEDPKSLPQKSLDDGEDYTEKPSEDPKRVPQKSPDDSEDYTEKPSEDPKPVPQKSPDDSEDYTEKSSEDPKRVPQKSPDDSEDYTEKSSEDPKRVPQKSPDDSEDYTEKSSEDPKPVSQKSPDDGEDYTEKPSEDPKPVPQKSPDDSGDYTEKSSDDPKPVPQMFPDGKDYIEPSADPESVSQISQDGNEYIERPSEDPKFVSQKSSDDEKCVEEPSDTDCPASGIVGDNIWMPGSEDPPPSFVNSTPLNFNMEDPNNIVNNIAIIKQESGTSSPHAQLTDDAAPKSPGSHDERADKLDDFADMPKLPESIFEVEVEDDKEPTFNQIGDSDGRRDINPVCDTLVSYKNPCDAVIHFSETSFETPKDPQEQSVKSQSQTQKFTERSEVFKKNKKKPYLVAEIGKYGRPILRPTKRLSMKPKRERNRTNLISEGHQLPPMTIELHPGKQMAESDASRRGQKRKHGTQPSSVPDPEDEAPSDGSTDNRGAEAPSQSTSSISSPIPNSLQTEDVMKIDSDDERHPPNATSQGRSSLSEELELIRRADVSAIDSDDEFSPVTVTVTQDEDTGTDFIVMKTDAFDPTVEIRKPIASAEILEENSMTSEEFDPITHPDIVDKNEEHGIERRETLHDNEDWTEDDENNDDVSGDNRDDKFPTHPGMAQLPTDTDKEDKTHLPEEDTIVGSGKCTTNTNDDGDTDERKPLAIDMSDNGLKRFDDSEKAIERPEYKISITPLVLIRKKPASKSDSSVSLEIYQGECVHLPDGGHVGPEESPSPTLTQVEGATELDTADVNSGQKEEKHLKVFEADADDKGRDVSIPDLFDADTDDVAKADEVEDEDQDISIPDLFDTDTDDVAKIDDVEDEDQDISIPDLFNIDTDDVAKADDVEDEDQDISIPDLFDTDTDDVAKSDDVEDEDQDISVPDLFDTDTDDVANVDDVEDEDQDISIPDLFDTDNDDVAKADDVEDEDQDISIPDLFDIDTDDVAKADDVEDEDQDISIPDLFDTETDDVAKADDVEDEDQDISIPDLFDIETDDVAKADDVEDEDQYISIPDLFDVDTDDVAKADDVEDEDQDISIPDLFDIDTDNVSKADEVEDEDQDVSIPDLFDADTDDKAKANDDGPDVNIPDLFYVNTVDDAKTEDADDEGQDVSIPDLFDADDEGQEVNIPDLFDADDEGQDLTIPDLFDADDESQDLTIPGLFDADNDDDVKAEDKDNQLSDVKDERNRRETDECIPETDGDEDGFSRRFENPSRPVTQAAYIQSKERGNSLTDLDTNEEENAACGQETDRTEQHENVPAPAIIRRRSGARVQDAKNQSQVMVVESPNITTPPRISQCLSDEDVDIGSWDSDRDIQDPQHIDNPFNITGSITGMGDDGNTLPGLKSVIENVTPPEDATKKVEDTENVDGAYGPVSWMDTDGYCDDERDYVPQEDDAVHFISSPRGWDKNLQGVDVPQHFKDDGDVNIGDVTSDFKTDVDDPSDTTMPHTNIDDTESNYNTELTETDSMDSSSFRANVTDDFILHKDVNDYGTVVVDDGENIIREDLEPKELRRPSPDGEIDTTPRESLVEDKDDRHGDTLPSTEWDDYITSPSSPELDINNASNIDRSTEEGSAMETNLPGRRNVASIDFKTPDNDTKRPSGNSTFFPTDDTPDDLLPDDNNPDLPDNENNLIARCFDQTEIERSERTIHVVPPATTRAKPTENSNQKTAKVLGYYMDVASPELSLSKTMDPLRPSKDNTELPHGLIKNYDDNDDDDDDDHHYHHDGSLRPTHVSERSELNFNDFPDKRVHGSLPKNDDWSQETGLESEDIRPKDETDTSGHQKGEPENDMKYEPESGIVTLKEEPKPGQDEDVSTGGIKIFEWGEGARYDSGEEYKHRHEKGKIDEQEKDKKDEQEKDLLGKSDKDDSSKPKEDSKSKTGKKKRKKKRGKGGKEKSETDWKAPLKKEEEDKPEEESNYEIDRDTKNEPRKDRKEMPEKESQNKLETDGGDQPEHKMNTKPNVDDDSPKSDKEDDIRAIDSAEENKNDEPEGAMKETPQNEIANSNTEDENVARPSNDAGSELKDISDSEMVNASIEEDVDTMTVNPREEPQPGGVGMKSQPESEMEEMPGVNIPETDNEPGNFARRSEQNSDLKDGPEVAKIKLKVGPERFAGNDSDSRLIRPTTESDGQDSSPKAEPDGQDSSQKAEPDGQDSSPKAAPDKPTVDPEMETSLEDGIKDRSEVDNSTSGFESESATFDPKTEPEPESEVGGSKKSEEDYNVKSPGNKDDGPVVSTGTTNVPDCIDNVIDNDKTDHSSSPSVPHTAGDMTKHTPQQDNTIFFKETSGAQCPTAENIDRFDVGAVRDSIGHVLKADDEWGKTETLDKGVEPSPVLAGSGLGEIETDTKQGKKKGKKKKKGNRKKKDPVDISQKTVDDYITHADVDNKVDEDDSGVKVQINAYIPLDVKTVDGKVIDSRLTATPDRRMESDKDCANMSSEKEKAWTDVMDTASVSQELIRDTETRDGPSDLNPPDSTGGDKINYEQDQKDSRKVDDNDEGPVDADVDQLDDSHNQSRDQEFVERQEFFMDSKPAAVIRVTGQLLDDVISNRARAEDVLAKNPEAARGPFFSDPSTSTPGGNEPSLTQAGHLMSEMHLLEDAAREQRDSLKLAVSEQDKYETEIRQLNAAISEAQQKLLASPVMATSVGALKQQIAEHNTLAAQIKGYQEKVKDINEKSRELAMNSAQLSPSLFRKHYLPESAYSDFFSAAAHHRAGSPLPTSSPLFFDTMTTFENQSPRTNDSEVKSSKEYKSVPETATRLSVGYTPRGSTLASKLISKAESPSQSPREADSMYLSGSQSFDTPRIPQGSESLESAYQTALSSTRTETPPLSARTYDTPLSSARSIETPPSSARAIGSAASTPRKYEPVSQTMQPQTAQTTHSQAPVVEFMVEKLSQRQRSIPKPPPGGRPTELLRMQDSTESGEDELPGKHPKYVSRTSEMSPRTSEMGGTKYASPRLQALSSSWKSASDTNLAQPAAMASTEDQPETPRMSAAAATSTPRSIKVIAGVDATVSAPDAMSYSHLIPVPEGSEQDLFSALSLDPSCENPSDSESETLEEPEMADSVLEDTVCPSQEVTPRAASSLTVPTISTPKPLSSSHLSSVTTPNQTSLPAKSISGAASGSLTSSAKSNVTFSRSELFTKGPKREESEQGVSPGVLLSVPRKSLSGSLRRTFGKSSFSVSETIDGSLEISANSPHHSIFSTQSSHLSEDLKYKEHPLSALPGPSPSSQPSMGFSAIAGDGSISSAPFGTTDSPFKTTLSQPTIMAPRERSSSFGTEAGPVGRPLAQIQADDKVKELNVSFNTLQEQVMTKEKELQAALLRQERYQQTVQELTAKMERAYMKLKETPASVALPLEAQMAEYKETVADIEGIREDIDKVKERGQLIVDSPDSEGHKAMEATLNMLADRFSNLQALADDKGRQLQEALKDREKHEIEMKAYQNRVADLKSWLEEAKVRQATTGLLSEDPVTLQRQLDENKDLQEQVNTKLQQLSDLALQCDALCEHETPARAEKLRNDLAALQNQLGQFKMDTIEKQAKLRASIKEAEKRQREMTEYDASVQRLQKWMTDTKEMTRPSEQPATFIAPTVHKELATDLKQHKQLVRQLSKRGLKDRASSSAVKPLTHSEVQESWERLDKHLKQKTRNLEDLLRTKKPGELVKVSLYAPSRHADSKRQLEEVKSVLNDMGKCWGQLQVQLDEKQLQLDEALSFQQQYQSALENISGYLDLCQQQVFTAPSTTEEHIRQNENLRKEIQSLQQEVTSISEQADDLVSSTGGANQPVIENCLSSLNNRIKLLDDTAQAQAEDLRKASREWKQYQAEVVELQKRLQDTQKLVLAPSSTQSLDQLMTNNQNIEAQLKKCETQLRELKSKEAALTECYPKGIFPSELVTLQSNFMELQRRAQEKKASLQKSVSVQDQYLKMLKDYASFVDTAQDKLKHDSISARDLNHLKQQLSAHKDFFSDLEVHKAILDSLAGQCDKATRRKNQAQHSSLSSLSYVLVDQASLHGQRLERLTRQWMELDEKHIQLQKNLTALEAQVPSPIASGDSLTTIQDKLSKYKRLQSELSDEKGAVFEVVDRGKQILHSINCPALETAITDLAEKWVSLNTDLTHELKRTETLGDQLSTFEAEAALFTSWLSTAKMTCASFKQLTPSDVQNIGSIRNKVEKVLEFRKEVENQLPLKNRLLKVGNELLQNKNYDTRGLSDRLRSYEEEWAQLEQGISKTEEFLHQAQMDLMPSRQALNELTNWIGRINKSLKADAKKRINSVADIELMVKKYKGYKIELSSKHMTLDFVNQAVLAPGPGETDVPHEKLEFADKLGELNKKWKQVVTAVDDRLNTLEGLQGKWEEYEQTHLRLQAWIKEQEDKITRYKLIGHEVGVKQTLRDCKAMQQQLQNKQLDLDSVKSLGNNLITSSKESPGCQQSVRESMSSLDQNWKRLEEQTRQLENLLTDMLGQWARYHTDLASLTQVLTQTEYCLQQYTLVGGDITTLRSQVAKLKDLETKLNQQSQHLDSFVTLANQLQQVCEPPVQADIQKTVNDIQTRWRQLSADLSTRCRLFERSLTQWEKYETLYNQILEWLKGKEQLCTDLITMRDDPNLRKESLARSRELQDQLDNITNQLSDLYKLSDQLTKNMNPSTITILTSRQSAIDQRLLALRQILSQHMATLKDDLSQMGQFNEAFEVVNNFLKYAESVLSPADPTKAAEEEHIQLRLDELKRLLSQFTSNMINLDHVNNIGYLLALNQFDATRLRELNHKWQDLLEDARERSRTLQTNLLIQQDFATKCEAWMAFLAQTEQDLANEIKANLPSLKDQLKRCEQFESEIYSRQQILHAIISDGQKMMKAGEVEDKDEFEQKLKLLAEQWQSVLRRANERKAIIESLIGQWDKFNSMSQQLMRWLKDKEAAMRAFEFDSTSLQSVRSLVEKVKTTEREFALQEASFKKIHDLGNNLLQRADSTSSQDIRETLDELQKSWFRVFSQLDEHRSRLEGVDRQWLECEDDIDDILNWLKDIRQFLHSDLPDSYDELQADMNRCKDIASSFVSSEDRRQRLLTKEKVLSRVIQADDLNLLHQRIRLMNKQWEELRHQTVIREQRLSEALYRWNNFGDRLRSLLSWISEMEVKVISNRDMHVEDLLIKLETVYNEEMREKEKEKNFLISQGQTLMKISSEVRASDIEQKLLRLEDKWTHLKAVMDFRHRKLQETVLAVKQLDSSMKNLTLWLSSVEKELSSAIAYKDSGVREIHSKLHDTQELQRDIERHSPGVSAVLNLCEVLLHDSDACPTETEFSALQHAMKSLEKRWRNICALCPARRSRVEETWQLWEKFREDCLKFSDWLAITEKQVKDSETDISNISMAKEEIRKYENLQRNVHDHLRDLEHINRQYRQLAKEGRTDTDGSLKVMMTDLNNRWDSLQLRVTEIMKKLRHSASIRQDFEATYTSLMTWLTEVDMQLTNIENLDGLDIETKISEIQRIEDEIQTKRHRMSYLDQAAVYLMQKGDSQDALRVQHQLDDFRSFSKSVFERVNTLKIKIDRMLVAQVENFDSPDLAEDRYFPSVEDRLKEIRDAQEAESLARQTAELEAYLEISPPESPPMKRRSDVSPSRVSLPASDRTRSPVRRAGAHVPRSGSPSPLRSSSPIRRSFSPTRRVSPSPSRTALDATDGQTISSPQLDIAQREKSAKIEILMEQLAESLDDANLKLARMEKALNARDPDMERSMRLLVDCETAVDTVCRLDRLLKTETGLPVITSVDHQVVSVLERWEQLQSRARDEDFRISQDCHDLNQFNNDLDNLLEWLAEAEALQASHQHLPADINQLEIIVRQYKDFLAHLESKKATVLSINLLSRNYLASKKEGTQPLKAKLYEMNRRWDQVVARAGDIQRDLQLALIQCQEFHRSINDYQLWLENMESQVRQCEPLNLNAGEAALWAKYTKLSELHNDLQRNHPKVMDLKETADQLLLSTDSPEMATARDKTHIISNRLRSLLHLTTAYISSLENKLKVRPKRGSASNSFDISEGRSSGLGSSYASRSSTPLKHGSAPVRSRTRSPFAISRQFLKEIFSPLLRPRSQDRDNLTSSDEMEEESEPVGTQVRPSLLMRVVRAALPIQLLLLLLLLLACLVPICEDETSCLLSNNLRRSFSPMLQYTDGPPPI